MGEAALDRTCDCLIVGGGVIGSAIAFFLAREAPSLRIVVLEPAPGYQDSSTARSAASIRQQFSTPENIRMSLFGRDFLRSIGDWLRLEKEPPPFDVPDVAFREGGYLFLATQAGAETLRRNHALQTSLGADIDLMAADALGARFPWLSVGDLALGALGRSGEGWFDALALLQGFRRKAIELGVRYVAEACVGVDAAAGRVSSVRLSGGGRIACGTLVNAAGAAAPKIAAMAGVGLPVASRKRFVFVFDCRTSIPDLPLLVDPTGAYVRPEGSVYICGTSPPPDNDPDCEDLDVDYSLFEDVLWPTLAARIPAFEAIKLTNAWAGHYAMNVLDQNAILGPHPGLPNFLFANGFSGHGLQQAPAVGRAIAERIVHGRYVSLDLSAFDYTRFAESRLVREANVV